MSRCSRSACVTARFGWPLEMVLRASAAGWAVGEVPVAYRDAQSAASRRCQAACAGSVRAVRDMRAVLAELA